MPTLPTWLPWVIIGVGLLAGGGLVLYNIIAGEEEDDDEQAESYDGGETTIGLDPTTLSEKDALADTAIDGVRGARKSRMIALKDSLEASLEARQGAIQADTKDRMSMPWFMLVGADGSGKTTVLANTGLPLPYGPAFEVDSRKKDAGRWWLYEDAVVLEAPAATAGAAATDSTLAPGQTVASDASEGWNTLLHVLRRERPDSPLNGIIVSISCADLVAAKRSSDRVLEQADRIRAFLERTRRVLDVRLPIHVLVTKCDVLPGFRSFVENLPEPRRNDIFGWANPNKLEAPFHPAWVDQGFETLQKQLEDLRDEVLAAPDEIADADGLFVFVNEFSQLQEPLRDFIGRLYPENERRPSLFFRGMYFSGDTIEQAAPAAPAEDMTGGATMQISSEAALPEITQPHNLVFLRSLFQDKIFREAGLARPVARFRLSRDRRVILAQAAAIAILLVGGAGLWTTLNGYGSGEGIRPGLREEAETLTRVFAGMAIDLDEVKRGAPADALSDRRVRDAAVIQLVGDMRDVRAIGRSPFIPASWFSELPAEVKASMRAGIEDIVLPVTRERLMERAQDLLRVPDSLDVADLSGDPEALTFYLDDVRALSRNIAVYNTLATPGRGTVRELSVLLDYLFGERIATDSAVGSEDFISALRDARATPIRVTPDMASSVVTRAMAMISRVAESASRQLAPRANAAAERAILPEDDLTALRGLGALVDLSDPRHGLAATISDSAILGVRVVSDVQDSIVAHLRLAATRITRDTMASDAAERRLRNGIDSLFRMRFMDPREDLPISAEIPAGQRLRWDVGRLELAFVMRNEFDQAVLTAASAFPGQSSDRWRRAFDPQLVSRILFAAASAQRFTPAGSSAGASQELRVGVANLEAAGGRVLRLAALLDSLKAGNNGKLLVAAATRQAEQAVVAAQQALDRNDFVEVQTAKVAAWQGGIPFGHASVGVIDSLAFLQKVLEDFNVVRELTSDVSPALGFLRRQGVDSTRVPRLLGQWENLRLNVAKHDNRDPSSSMLALYRYVKEDLAFRDMQVCQTVAQVADTTKPSTDLFVARRRQFRAAVAARCGDGGAAAVVNYAKLRALFETKLAGRYPFADSAQAAVRVDADPAAVREFLRQYDAFVEAGEVSLRSDPRLAASTAGALAFLDQMNAVRAFFGTFVDDSNRRTLDMVLVVDPAERADGRELVVGRQSTAVGDQAQELAWRYGDAVRVTRRDSTGVARPLLEGSGWAVLELAKHAPVRFFDPVTMAELTPPPRFPAAAPEIVLPRR